MDDFLKHPRVQYIPLLVHKPLEGDWQNPFENNSPRLFIFQNAEELSAKLSHYNLPEVNPAPEDANNYLGVLALNFQVKRGYFRFLTIKFVGIKQENYYQVFYVTKKYFPQRTLHFTLYTEKGEKVAWENIDVK